MTASELIAERAAAAEPNMDLTSWKADIVRKGDVTIAKNYLRDDEISEINRIVVMFLDFAEGQAKRRKQVFLNDWKEKLDGFPRFNACAVLPDARRVSPEAADKKAEREYQQVSARRRARLEADAERDGMKELDAAIRKLPERGDHKED